MSEAREETGSRNARRDVLRLIPEQLRWRCSPECLAFESTEDVEPTREVIGQDDAVEALRFGLEVVGNGHNVFVRGLTGTGRMTLLRQLLEELRPSRPVAGDRCYVHNFQDPIRPRLITLAPGEGPAFRRSVHQLIDFIGRELIPSLSSEKMQARRAELDASVQARVGELGSPFERELQEAGLAVVPVQTGQTMQPTILPVVEGQALPMQAFEKLRASGKIPPDEAQRILGNIARFESRFADVSEKIQAIQEEHRRALQQLYETEARMALGTHIRSIQEAFPQPEVNTFLNDLADDLLARGLETLEEDRTFLWDPLESTCRHASLSIL